MNARELFLNWNANRRNIGIKLANKGKFAHDTLVVTNMRDYGDGQIHITVINPDGSSYSNYLTDKDEVTMVGEEDIAGHMTAFEKKQLENLHNQLAHGGNSAARAEFFFEDENGVCIPATFLGTENKSSSLNRNWSGTSNPSYQVGFGAGLQTIECSCLARTIDSMAFGIKDMYTNVRKTHPTARVSTKSVMMLSDDQLASADARLLPFGLGSDIKNAYGIKRINHDPSKAPDPKSIKFRTAHAAMQFQFYNLANMAEEKAKSVVKTVDATLGVACVSLLNGLNHPDYIKLGSLPGDYKVTGSGMVYHTLSNSWMIHPMIANLVYDFARKCVTLGDKGLGKYWNASEDEVISCMMDLDVEKSHAIMERNKELMMKLFQAAWPICNGSSAAGVPNLSADIPPEKARDIIWDVFQNGIGTLVKDIGDMASNWTLDGTWIEHSEGDGKNVWRTINENFGKRKFKNEVVY